MTPHVLQKDQSNKEKEKTAQLAKKVYCKNCIWFRGSWWPPFLEKCLYLENWVDTWKEKIRGLPWDINKNNDCKWFNRRLIKPLSKGISRRGPFFDKVTRH